MNMKQQLRRSVSHYITKKTVVDGQIVNRPSWFRTVQMWQLRFGHVIDLQAYARKSRIPTIDDILTPAKSPHANNGISVFSLTQKHLEHGLNMSAVYPLDEKAEALLAAQFTKVFIPRKRRRV